MVLQAVGPLQPRGAAIAARRCAEISYTTFAPGAGLLTEIIFRDGARCDGWIATGTEVMPFYDPMLAKIIVSGPDRSAALDALRRALARTRVSGIETNLENLRPIAASGVLGSRATFTLGGFGGSGRAVAVHGAGG